MNLRELAIQVFHSYLEGLAEKDGSELSYEQKEAAEEYFFATCDDTLESVSNLEVLGDTKQFIEIGCREQVLESLFTRNLPLLKILNQQQPPEILLSSLASGAVNSLILRVKRIQAEQEQKKLDEIKKKLFPPRFFMGKFATFSHN